MMGSTEYTNGTQNLLIVCPKKFVLCEVCLSARWRERSNLEFALRILYSLLRVLHSAEHCCQAYDASWREKPSTQWI